MIIGYEPWPRLSYSEFKSTQYLLHMLIQAIGKLKLNTPFEMHWGNVALWLSSRGLTTGVIPYETGTLTVELDLIAHQVICTTSWGGLSQFNISSNSVAELTNQLFIVLSQLNITPSINPLPQEVPNPIPFHEDKEIRSYQPALANAWWRILLSSYRVMQKYHSRFNGITPPIGLMWGTLDIRDVRYKGIHLPTEGANAGYIRRNAMDDAQVEAGWWSGNEQYPKPAYYAFVYPQPEGIEHARILPAAAKWNATLGEFILDYDDVRNASNPESILFDFLESTYNMATANAQWDPQLVVTGEPV